NDVQRCQGLYYAAERLQTEGNETLAQQVLAACLSLETPCLEQQLAAWQVADQGGSGVVTGEDATVEEINRLNRQTVQLCQQGRYADALPLARRVCDLALEQRGAEHPDTATSFNNLG